MAANVGINRKTGAGPVDTRVDVSGGSGSTRASTSDAPTPGTTNPIPIPAAGTNYSFWVVLQLNAFTTPAGTINNIKWYLDGTNSWTGVTFEVGTSPVYTQATGTTGATGDQLTDTNYTVGTLTPTTPTADNGFTYTSASPLAVTGTLSNPATGAIGDFVAYQLSVGTTAGAGTLSAENITFQYDET